MHKGGVKPRPTLSLKYQRTTNRSSVDNECLIWAFVAVNLLFTLTPFDDSVACQICQVFVRVESVRSDQVFVRVESVKSDQVFVRVESARSAKCL